MDQHRCNHCGGGFATEAQLRTHTEDVERTAREELARVQREADLAREAAILAANAEVDRIAREREERVEAERRAEQARQAQAFAEAFRDRERAAAERQRQIRQARADIEAADARLRDQIVAANETQARANREALDRYRGQQPRR